MDARYDAVAGSYAGGGDRYDGSAVAALLDLVGPHPGPRALDLACGHGPLARELARRGAQVTGLDLSGELLRRAVASTEGVDRSIDYVLGDAADPHVLAGASFDLIVSNFGLSDIDDLDGACHNVARLLVPGGRFVFSILHPCFAGGPRVSASWPPDGTYYDEGWWRADGELSTLRQQVGANHRMLSTYLNAFTAGGLVLDAVVEPRPEVAWAAQRPGAAALPVYLVAALHRSAVGP